MTSVTSLIVMRRVRSSAVNSFQEPVYVGGSGMSLLKGQGVGG